MERKNTSNVSYGNFAHLDTSPEAQRRARAVLERITTITPEVEARAREILERKGTISPEVEARAREALARKNKIHSAFGDGGSEGFSAGDDSSGETGTTGDGVEVKTCYCNQHMKVIVEIDWINTPTAKVYECNFELLAGIGCEEECAESKDVLRVFPRGDEDDGGYTVHWIKDKCYGKCDKKGALPGWVRRLGEGQGWEDATDACEFTWGTWRKNIMLDEFCLTQGDGTPAPDCKPPEWAKWLVHDLDYGQKCPGYDRNGFKGKAKDKVWCDTHPVNWEWFVKRRLNEVLVANDVAWDNDVDALKKCKELQSK